MHASNGAADNISTAEISGNAENAIRIFGCVLHWNVSLIMIRVLIKKHLERWASLFLEVTYSCKLQNGDAAVQESRNKMRDVLD